MKLTLLGTGTSCGVPVIGCQCEVCRSEDPRDKRTRCSALVETETTRILIDCGPDFRQQILPLPFLPFDAILTYADKDDDKTNLAISRIQALMVATETRMIYELAEAGKLTDSNYLIKDGSLEYRDDVLSDLRWKDIGGRMQYVVGVSKNFNADLFEVRQNSQKQFACKPLPARASPAMVMAPVPATWQSPSDHG